MLKVILKRILHTLPLLLAMTIVVFIIVDAMPGDELTAYINSLPEGTPRPSYEQISQMRSMLEFDKPWFNRYLDWLTDVVRGNFGISLYYRAPVVEIVPNLIWHTFMINSFALILTFLLSIPLGVRSAVHKNGLFDRVMTTSTLILVSLPSFFIGLYLMRLFAVKLGITPATGMHSVLSVVKGYESRQAEILDVLHHMILPVMTLTLVELGTVSRYVRNAMVEVIHHDYIRTARSKGLKERVVIYRHAFRNALIPVISLFGVLFPTLFVGNIFVEAIFSWPGIGLEFLASVYRRDASMISMFILFFSVASILGNLLADLLYGVADPRIKVE